MLRLCAAGKRVAEIAEEMGVRPSTVDEYLGRATRKLGARTRTQAVAIAVRDGLV